jgi:hypothetical protein
MGRDKLRICGDGVFEYAPYFKFNDGDVKFDANDVSNANDNYGSASGVFPKYLLILQKVSFRIPFVFFDALFVHRPDPAAKHSPDLVDDLLKSNIFLGIKCLCFFHKTDEETQDI